MSLPGEGKRGNPPSFPNFRNEVLKSKVLPILNLIRKLYETGESYPTKIGRLLGIGPKLAWYYINELEKHGYVEAYVKSNIKLYRLTQPGLNLLEMLERGFVGRRVRLERVVFKYPVLVDARVPLDWRKVELRNWGQLHGRVCGVFVRKNPGSLEVFTEPIEGDDPWELYYYARVEADFVARQLEKKFGMKLGIPEVSSRPEFAIYDPVANKYTEFFNLKNDVGKMDRSPPRRLGEIDWLSPNAAKEYLLMPFRIRELLERIIRLESGLTQIFQTWLHIGNRLLEILPAHGPAKCRICGEPTICIKYGTCTFKQQPDLECLYCEERLCEKHYVQWLNEKQNKKEAEVEG